MGFGAQSTQPAHGAYWPLLSLLPLKFSEHPLLYTTLLFSTYWTSQTTMGPPEGFDPSQTIWQDLDGNWHGYGTQPRGRVRTF